MKRRESLKTLAITPLFYYLPVETTVETKDNINFWLGVYVDDIISLSKEKIDDLIKEAKILLLNELKSKYPHINIYSHRLEFLELRKNYNSTLGIVLRVKD